MRFFNKQTGAFPCQTKQGCPEARLKPGAKGFCPAWQETSITEENVTTGESRFMRGCYFEVQLRAMEHVIHASNRPAAELGAMRGEMAKAVEKAVAGFFERLDPTLVAAALAAQEIGNEKHSAVVNDVKRFQLKHAVGSGSGNGATRATPGTN